MKPGWINLLLAVLSLITIVGCRERRDSTVPASGADTVAAKLPEPPPQPLRGKPGTSKAAEPAQFDVLKHRLETARRAAEASPDGSFPRKSVADAIDLLYGKHTDYLKSFVLQLEDGPFRDYAARRLCEWLSKEDLDVAYQFITTAFSLEEVEPLYRRASAVHVGMLDAEEVLELLRTAPQAKNPLWHKVIFPLAIDRLIALNPDGLAEALALAPSADLATKAVEQNIIGRLTEKDPLTALQFVGHSPQDDRTAAYEKLFHEIFVEYDSAKALEVLAYVSDPAEREAGARGIARGARTMLRAEAANSRSQE